MRGCCRVSFFARAFPPGFLLFLLLLRLGACFQPISWLPATAGYRYPITNQRISTSLHDATKVRDAYSPAHDFPKVKNPAKFACRFCQTEFDSRNAIFRHLRADGCTEGTPSPPGSQDRDPIVKQSLAISFSYVGHYGSTEALNVRAGQEVLNKLEEAIIKYSFTDENGEATALDFQLQESWTQSSIAGMRSDVLQQEPDCAASRDVIIVSGTCLQSMVPHVEDMLARGLPYGKEFDAQNSKGLTFHVRISSCKLLSEDVHLHAERSCTQLSYHYLLPLAWMPDASLLLNDWKGWEEKPPTQSLQKLKLALRRMESAMLTKKELEEPSPYRKIAARRYGRLAAKERKAWHNFADPSLRGKVSPNHEMIWRCVDACRMVDMVHFGSPNAALIIEVRGDGFLPTQVRRMIGTALAIAHEWLPMEVLDNDGLFSPFDVTETVLAPPGRLYLSNCRFHFEESRTLGKQLFETDICGKLFGETTSDNSIRWVQQRLLATSSQNQEKQPEMADNWLTSEKVVASRILSSLKRPIFPSANVDAVTAIGTMTEPPEVYLPVLEHLRRIVEKGQWPDTSVARSSVIRSETSSGVDSLSGKSGSFTVINPSALRSLQEQNSQEEMSTPHGNHLFPELVDAVFRLEEELSELSLRRVELDADGRVFIDCEERGKMRRSPSTHCAINSRAQFTPHVDSGRGLGQSLSLIVGLGDYEHGELLVEGRPCDIRYSPLEFNGWTLRHWTKSYIGERFSLVWFTPEMKGGE